VRADGQESPGGREMAEGSGIRTRSFGLQSPVLRALQAWPSRIALFWTVHTRYFLEQAKCHYSVVSGSACELFFGPANSCKQETVLPHWLMAKAKLEVLVI
jgi:hypothetical protein